MRNLSQTFLGAAAVWKIGSAKRYGSVSFDQRKNLVRTRNVEHILPENWGGNVDGTGMIYVRCRVIFTRPRVQNKEGLGLFLKKKKITQEQISLIWYEVFLWWDSRLKLFLKKGKFLKDQGTVVFRSWQEKRDFKKKEKNINWMQERRFRQWGGLSNMTENSDSSDFFKWKKVLIHGHRL